MFERKPKTIAIIAKQLQAEALVRRLRHDAHLLLHLGDLSADLLINHVPKSLS